MAVSPVERSLKLEAKLEAARSTLAYHRAYFKETFSDELWQAMEHRGLNQAEFAQKANVRKQFLTKVFRGGNCTMDTIVNLAYALNYRAHVHLTPNDIGCAWIHRIPQSIPRRIEENLLLWSGHKYNQVVHIEKEVECATLPSDS